LKFEYRVRDVYGRLQAGTLEADDRTAVISSFLTQNYYILSLKEIRPSIIGKNINLTIKKPPLRELLILTNQLRTMLVSGLPLIRAFNVLADQTKNKKLKETLVNIREKIEEGIPLWQALARHPGIFSPLYINMVRAGETGGILDSALERLAMHLEREEEIISKIKTASIYPVIVACFAFLVVLFILAFVMPTFTGIFYAMGVALPLPTRILLAVGTFMKRKWLVVLILAAAAAAALKTLGKTSQGRYFFDNLYLKIPVVGKFIAKITVARFARTMGTLIKSGISVIQALEIAEGVINNAVISSAIRQSRESITEGDFITVPLQTAGVFEPMVIQMIAVGEETGALDEMLLRMSDHFDRETMYAVESMMAALEPFLILFVALIVGSVVIATLLPVFELVNVIGTGV